MTLSFFFNDTATTEIYTLSLHDALPIYAVQHVRRVADPAGERSAAVLGEVDAAQKADRHRSEEHTSELQSQSNLVCRLLLEKKKNRKHPWWSVCGSTSVIEVSVCSSQGT